MSVTVDSRTWAGDTDHQLAEIKWQWKKLKWRFEDLYMIPTILLFIGVLYIIAWLKGVDLEDVFEDSTVR